MAVAHDAVTESHIGTTSSTSEASFSWTHTPSGTPKGVLVFTFIGPYNGASRATARATGVTYGGVSLSPSITDGRAVDTVGLPGDCESWYLGSGVPTGAQSVVVTRTNDASSCYAVCITVTASTNTETTGVVLLEEDQALVEQNVTDGSPGTNSVRYAGVNSGSSSVPGTGANSTALANIDYGIRTCAVVRETTAGQGSRPVGFSQALDDVAAVHVAVREAFGTDASPTPTTVAGTTTIPTPAVTADANVTPTTVAAVVAVDGVSVAADPQNADVTPTTVAATVSVPTPAVTADANVTPTTVAAAVDVPTPATPAPPVAGAFRPRLDVRVARIMKHTKIRDGRSYGIRGGPR